MYQTLEDLSVMFSDVWRILKYKLTPKKYVDPRLYHDNVIYQPPYKSDINGQKLHHIYMMLKIEKLRDLATDHEPDELMESLKSYDHLLKSKAELLSYPFTSSSLDDITEAALKHKKKFHQIDDKLLDSLKRYERRRLRRQVVCIVGLGIFAFSAIRCILMLIGTKL